MLSGHLVCELNIMKDLLHNKAFLVIDIAQPSELSKIRGFNR